MTQDQDRGRGGLTPEDRAFLSGETEYQYQQSEVNTRRRIRERVRNTLLDFPLLLYYLADDDFEQMIDSFEGMTQRRELKRALASMVGFVYFESLTGDRGFEYYIARGIERAEDRRHQEVANVHAEVNNLDVTLTLDSFSKPDFDRTLERIESGDLDSLTGRERAEILKVLVGADMIDTDALREANLKRYGTGVDGSPGLDEELGRDDE